MENIRLLSLKGSFVVAVFALSCGAAFHKTIKSANEAIAEDAAAELAYHPTYINQARGQFLNKSVTPGPWPVQVLSIGHTMASYQDYGGGAYFHHGIDIRAEAGSSVVLPVNAEVIKVSNYNNGIPAYWEIAVRDDDGFVWQFHHVERNSIPEVVFNAEQSGQHLAAGTKIGEVYFWQVTTFGEVYHHVHLNILGEGGEFVNGFAFLQKLNDVKAPIVKDIAILQNGQRRSGSFVSGAYSLLVQIDDLILHDQFVVPPYVIRFSVDGGTKETLWQFDRLPGGNSETQFVDQLYVPGLVCGDYECRKPIMDLGFAPLGNRVFPQTHGAHHVEIDAADFEGNQATGQFNWTVQ